MSKKKLPITLPNIPKRQRLIDVILQGEYASKVACFLNIDRIVGFYHSAPNTYVYLGGQDPVQVHDPDERVYDELHTRFE